MTGPFRARAAARLLPLVLLVGCGGSSTTKPGADAGVPGADAAAPQVDAACLCLDGTPADGATDTLPQDALPADAGADDDAPADAAGGDGGSPKTSLASCWLDPTCHRALVISHGGDWNLGAAPFLSRAAFERAVTCGAHGIEVDVLVTLDGVPVVAHSSPIELYESFDCSGQKIEEMTADEVTSCHLGLSLTETFQRLDAVIDWAAGKVILELDVKVTGDLAAAVALIRQRGAQDRVTILVGTGEIATTIPTLTGWDELHYLVDIGSGAEVAPQVGLAAAQRAFMFELDRSYADATEAQVSALITGTLAPAGIKAYGASDQYAATVQNHLDVFHLGFDAILSYNCANGVAAASQVNVERGYPP